MKSEGKTGSRSLNYAKDNVELSKIFKQKSEMLRFTFLRRHASFSWKKKKLEAGNYIRKLFTIVYIRDYEDIT